VGMCRDYLHCMSPSLHGASPRATNRANARRLRIVVVTPELNVKWMLQPVH
jgi:hypothetical protein